MIHPCYTKNLKQHYWQENKVSNITTQHINHPYPQQLFFHLKIHFIIKKHMLHGFFKNLFTIKL